MSRVASLISDFTADDRSFQRVSARVEKTMQGIQRRVGTVVGVVGTAFAAVGVGVGAAAGALAFAARQASDAEDAHAKLLAVLKATGHGAGVTTDQLSAFAKKMQSVTKFEDDATKASLAVLASFRNIKGDNFTRAAEAAMDLATVTGTDLQSAMRLVGKALNAPKVGLAALQRSGVAFTAEQRRMIQAFDQLGLSAKAQDVILKVLTKSFGGAALAAGGTLSGQLTILKNELGDVGEQVGTVLLPHLKSFAKWLRSVVPNVAEVEAQIAKVRATVDAVAESLGRLPGAVQDNIDLMSVAFEDFGLTVQIVFEQIRQTVGATMAAVRQDIGGVVADITRGQLDAALAGQGLIAGSMPLVERIQGVAAGDTESQRRIDDLIRQRNEIFNRRIQDSPVDNRARPSAATKAAGGIDPFRAVAGMVADMAGVAERVGALLGAGGQALLGAAWKEAGKRAKAMPKVEPRVGGFSGLAEMHKSLQAAAFSDPKTDKVVKAVSEGNGLLAKMVKFMEDNSKKPARALFS